MKRVFQSVRHAFEIGTDPSEGPSWSSHLEAVAPVDYSTEDGVILLDGRRIEIDVIIFATGYLYSFPYYHQTDVPFNKYPLTRVPALLDGHVTPDNRSNMRYPDGGLQVHNIDADYQTFYYPDPTLAFICLNKSVVPCNEAFSPIMLYG